MAETRMSRMIAAEKELLSAARRCWGSVSDVADELETERDRLVAFMREAGITDAQIDYIRESTEKPAVVLATYRSK